MSPGAHKDRNEVIGTDQASPNALSRTHRQATSE